MIDLIEDPHNQIAKTIMDWSAKSSAGWCAVEDPMNSEAEYKQLKEFQELCKPLVVWLQKNYCPQIKIEVTPDSATLSVGQMGTAYEWDYCDTED